MGVPLGEKFNGKVGTLTPNFSPPNYSREVILGAFKGGAPALLNFQNLGTWASKFGQEKIFSEKIFFDRKLDQQNGHKFAAVSYTHLTLPTIYSV